MRRNNSSPTESGNAEEKRQHTGRPGLRAVAKERMRQAGALVIALVIFLTTAFGSLPEGSLSFLGDIGEQVVSLFGNAEAEAATTTIHETVVYGIRNISALDYNWEFEFFTTNNTPSGAKSTVFCMNPGSNLCSDLDTYSYTSTYAINYDTTLAKVVTWWFGNKSDCINQSGISYKYNGTTYKLDSTAVHTAIQGYVWAYKKGKNVKNVISEMLTDFCGVSSTAKANAAADTIMSAISSVHIYGTIYEYTCTECGKWYSASSHQKMLGWSPTDVDPETKQISYSESVTGDTTITITINKKDSSTKSLIDTAEFNVKYGNVNISSTSSVKSLNVKSGKITGISIDTTTGSRNGSTFTTEGGKVVIKYTISYETVKYTTETYTYVTNWDKLSYWKKLECLNKGYYSNKSDAVSDAKVELKKGKAELKTALVNSIQSKKVKVTETKAPKGHALASTTTQTKTPSSKKVTFTFTNQPKYGKVYIWKTAALDDSYTGDDATLKGAVYYVYAAQTIYDTDNKTVLFESGKPITYDGEYVTITTNKNGKGHTSSVLPAGYRYYVKEKTPSTGYTLDTEKHYFKLVINDDGSVTTYECDKKGNITDSTANSSSNPISSDETQVWGRVSVTKYMENADGTTSLENGAVFYVVKKDAVLEYFNTASESTATNKLAAMSESERQAVILGSNTKTGTGYEYMLTTNAKGYAESGDLPYGEYYLIQTDGDDACELAKPKVVSITAKANGSDNGTTDNYEFTNPRKTAGIEVTKDMSGYESDGTQYSLAEEGATFVVLYASKVSESLDNLSAMKTAKERQTYVSSLGSSAVYATLVTDENGEASVEVDAGVAYIIFQTDGEEGCTLADAESIALEAEQAYTTYYAATNYVTQHSFEITKTMADSESDTGEPEAGAVFAIIKESAVTESAATINKMTAEERAAYVNGLSSSSIIGTITTDTDGKGCLYWDDVDYDGEFVVIQTSGTDGYSLMPAMYSEEATSTGSSTEMKKTVTGEKKQLTSYFYSYKDTFTEWAKIAVQKTYESANGVWTNEEGAEFTVTDFAGDEVAWITTDSTGYGVAVDENGDEALLAYGIYYVTQTASGKGAENTTFADPEVVILTESNRQKTVEFTAKNPENGYLFTLTKLSDDTDAGVNGATYKIVAEEDILDGDGNVTYKKGKTVATITTGSDDETGEDGVAEVWLPYGYYHIEETDSPVTFVTSEECTYFILDENGITVVGGITTDAAEVTEKDEDGNTSTYYSVSFTTYDTPIYGSIYVNKYGQVVYSASEAGGFTYTSEALGDATYALYARDDILNDAGEVVWAAGTYITSATTGSDGTAQFFWDKDGDGTAECADFYLGNYYIVETEAPEGFVCDDTEYEVGLTWNTSPTEKNDMSDPEESSALYNTENTYETSGEYVMLPGEDINALIKDAVSVTFTWSSPADGTNTTDISTLQDGTVVMWDDGDGNYYISSCNTRHAVIFNGNSSYMFYMCTSLEEVYFDAVDTSEVIDMRFMFYMCMGLTRLDLTSFDTTNVQYTDYMFMGCTGLEKIYVTEPVETGSGTTYVYTGEEYTSEITATASGTVMDGDEITWENFYYTRYYRVDYIVEDNMESIELSASDIASVTPSVASPDNDGVVWIDENTYTMEVEITLSDTCAYYCTNGTYSNTLTATITVMIPDEDAELSSQEHAEATVEVYETPVTVSIEVSKVSETGNPLAGAEFTLYANCDIVNKDGTVIYNAGQEIMNTTSSGESIPNVKFSGLPTDLYAVSGTYLAEASNAVYCYAGGTTGSTAAGDSMFYVVETKAPDGYKKEDKTWYLTGSISDYVAADDTDFTGVIAYSYTAVNTELEYLVLQKAWDDADGSSNRPDYVVFLAKSSSGTAYTVALYEDKAYLFAYNGIGGAIYGTSNYSPKAYASYALCSWDVDCYTENSGGTDLTVWSVALDDSLTVISGGSSFTSPFTTDSGYTFTENETLLISMTGGKSSSTYYYMYAQGWMNTDQTVWRTTNKPISNYTSASVQKTWDDNSDEKGIRPAELYVTLWQEDSKGNAKTYSTLTSGIKLSDDNSWYYYYSTDQTLPIEDSYGGEYTYYWTENGKAQTASSENIAPDGYSVSSYSYKYDEDENVWYTEITNSTEITVPVTVTKTWDDYDDTDGIRPDTIYVQLYADDVLVDVNGDEVTQDTTADTAVALNAANGWSVTFGVDSGTTELPKYNSSGNEIVYKFAEVTSAATLIVGGKTVTVTVGNVSWYTGSVDTGYAESYAYSIGTEGTAVKNTEITNKHTPKGEITIEKTVLADDVIYYAKAHDGEDPVFTFTLTDPDGDTETFTLTFDASALTAGSGYVTASTTYSSLDFGEYTITEDTQPDGWEFVSLDCTNGDADTDYREAAFDLDEDNISASFVATYTDEYVPEGAIIVTKTISETELDAYLEKYGEDPDVTFTLYDESGSVVESQTVTFTADSVADNGYVTESAAFESVEIGKYTLEESDMPDTWNFVSLTGTNGTVSGQTVTFEITKENALQTFAAAFTDEYPTGSITVTKKVLAEEVEAYNADAEFTFTLYDDSGKEVESKTVTIALADCMGKASGTYVTASATFEALEFGEYTLKETGMPSDWEFVEIESVTAGTVNAGGDDPDSVSFYLTADTYTQAFEATFVDEYINGSVTVIKYGSDGKTKLDGVTYTLYDADGKVIATKTTGKNGEESGQVVFTDLKKGSYILTETSTIDGYSLLADEIEITIPLIMTDDEIDAYEKAYGITIDVLDAVAHDGEYWFYNLTYEVTDSAVMSLPATGKGLAWFALALIIGGFALANICARYMQLKRYRKEVRTMLQE